LESDYKITCNQFSTAYTHTQTHVHTVHTYMHYILDLMFKSLDILEFVYSIHGKHWLNVK